MTFFGREITYVNLGPHVYSSVRGEGSVGERLREGEG